MADSCFLPTIADMMDLADATRAVTGAPSDFMSSGDPFSVNASNTAPLDGYHDVIMHSNGTTFGDTPTAFREGTDISPAELAQKVRSDPNYPGGKVRLLACSAAAPGATAGQSFANALGQEVLAATGKLWAYPDGRLTIGRLPSENSGSWVTLSPECE
jgi:hypothetical protein